MRRSRFLRADVFDQGHHRPPLSERIHNRREPVARHEGLRPLTDRGIGPLSARDDVVDVGPVQRERVRRKRGLVGSGEFVCLSRIGPLKPPIAEIKLGMRDDALGSVHPVHQGRAEYVDVEPDRCGRAVDARERGQAGVALRNRSDALACEVS